MRHGWVPAMALGLAVGAGTAAHAQEQPVRAGTAASPQDQPFVSVAAMGADIRGVLLAIGEQAGLDVVIDTDVQGAVTLEIDDTSLAEALEAVIGPTRYDYRIEGRTLRVYGEQVATRLFTVDYVTGVRTGLTQLSASSGSAPGSTTGTQETSTGGNAGTAAQSSSTVNSESSSDPWSEIIRGLEMIVYGTVGALSGAAPEGPERLVVHRSAGVVLVTAPYATLNRVALFLESVQGSAQRQVLIEARIVEIALSDGYEMGIDWSRIPGAARVTDVFGRDEVGVAQKLSPSLGAFQIAGSAGDFNMLMDALSKQGRLKVVGSPRVATLNNQKAIMKVAREESFFTLKVEYQYQPDGSRVPVSSVEPQRITIGLILDVTPQIGPGGEIMMHVHPSLTELVGEDIFPPDATGEDVQANAPVLDIREIDTVVQVADGSLLAIGGLSKERRQQTVRSVPLLGKIPLLGQLFSHTVETTEQVELLVCLKPTVVIGREASEAASEALGELERRMAR